MTLWTWEPGPTCQNKTLLTSSWNWKLWQKEPGPWGSCWWATNNAEVQGFYITSTKWDMFGKSLYMTCLSRGKKKTLPIYFCSFILKGCFLGFSKEQIDLSAAKGNRLRAFMCTSNFQLQLCIHSCDQNRLVLKEGHAVLHPLPQHK